MSTPAPVSMRERLRMDYQWTPRQREVLALVARGKSNTEIAEALGVSLAGAKWHVSEILSKLQAEQREEAADYWRRYNGVAPRFARVFRGIAGIGVWKWVAGATVATVIGGGALLAVVALRDDDSSPVGTAAPASDASPTPGVTPTTTVSGFDTAWGWDSGAPGATIWLRADASHVVVSHTSGDRARGGTAGLALLSVTDGKEVWRFETPAHAFPAALTADRVVAGTADGTVYALDRATGREVWRQSFPGVPFEVVAAGEVVVVADRDPETDGPGDLADKTRMSGRLWALDLASGDLRWEAQAGDFSVFVAVSGDTVLVTTESPTGRNEVLGLDAATGERRMRVTAEASYGVPAVAGDLVIVPGSRLAATHMSTGYLVWAAAPSNGGTFFHPVVFGDTVAALTNTGTFELRSLTDGTLVAASEIGDCSGQPLVVGSRLFLLACGSLHAWNPATSSLDLLFTPQGNIDAVASAGGLIILSTGTGHSGEGTIAIRPRP